MYYVSTGIHSDLLGFIEGEEYFESDTTLHGPHIIVASEPTTINPNEWYELQNRQALLVDIVTKTRRKLGDVETIEIKPATYEDIGLTT
jgi:hypothetical protein